MRVAVYFNLHKRCFSLRAEEGDLRGIVIGHADQVVLTAVTCHVRAAGQATVRATRVKNVHAFLRGDLVSLSGFAPTKRAAEMKLQLEADKAAPRIPDFSNNGSIFGYDPYVDHGFTSRMKAHCGTYITAARAALLSITEAPRMLDPEMRPIPA
ncbi:hypothetical protein ACGYLO_11880 [Sulfitobacter sp. 1A13353]|uniref:hypothetical protein n=1 Tax=Sulfitobacter sp. 1A13353 TaxID=3368568 RepID=UPI0037464E81